MVKAAMAENRPVRVNAWNDDSYTVYRGYLFRMSGNCYRIVKFHKPDWILTHPELMGQVLSGKLWVDGCAWDMPEYYRKFLALTSDKRNR